MSLLELCVEYHIDHSSSEQDHRDQEQQEGKKSMTTYSARQVDTFVNTTFGSVCPSTATSKEAIKTTRVILE